MENFKYRLLKNIHSNTPCLGFSETGAEVRIGPAGMPVLHTLLVSLAVLGFCLIMGVSSLERGETFWSGPVIIACLFGALGLVATAIQSGMEKERGPVFLLNRMTGRYSFPRERTEGPRTELVETALVASNMEIDGARLYELQLLVRRGDAAPVAMLLMGSCGPGPLHGIQEKLAAALKLPAVRVREPG